MNNSVFLVVTSLLMWMVGCQPVTVQPIGEVALDADPGIGFQALAQSPNTLSDFPSASLFLGDTVIRHRANDSWSLVYQDYSDVENPGLPRQFSPIFWPTGQPYSLDPVVGDPKNRTYVFQMYRVNGPYGYVVADLRDIPHPRRRVYFTIPEGYPRTLTIIGLYDGYLLAQQTQPTSRPDSVIVYNLNPLMDRDSTLHSLNEARIGAFPIHTDRGSSTVLKDGFLFTAGMFEQADASVLEVFDFSDPAHVHRVSEMTGIAGNAMMVSGNTLICRASESLFSVDITDPMHPRPGMGISKRFVYGAAVHNGLLYMVSDYDTYLDIIDVSNARQWKHLRRFSGVGASSRIIFIEDKIVLGGGKYFTGNTY